MTFALGMKTVFSVMIGLGAQRIPLGRYHVLSTLTPSMSGSISTIRWLSRYSLTPSTAAKITAKLIAGPLVA
jgi:hypothetical protein